MKSQLIIELDTSSRPMVRVRDTLLLITCWGLWATVLLALLNGCEWENLAATWLHFLEAQEIVFASILASFHIPPLYVFLTLLLGASCMLWSLIHLALAPMSHRQKPVAALTVADMARHFHLDQALVDAMQKEKNILVSHTVSGAVNELRCIPELRQQQLLRA